MERNHIAVADKVSMKVTDSFYVFSLIYDSFHQFQSSYHLFEI